MAFVTNIQWKGTDLCMDFICPSCGENTHIDGMFCYVLKCGPCGAMYKMPSDIGSLLVKTDNAEKDLVLETD